MNWSTFLVNDFMEYYKEVQEKSQLFHYTWLLILIVLVAWREMDEFQFLDTTNKPFLEAKYANMWFTKKKRRPIDKIITFFVYCDSLWHIIKTMSHMKQ